MRPYFSTTEFCEVQVTVKSVNKRRTFVESVSVKYFRQRVKVKVRKTLEISNNLIFETPLHSR